MSTMFVRRGEYLSRFTSTEVFRVLPTNFSEGYSSWWRVPEYGATSKKAHLLLHLRYSRFCIILHTRTNENFGVSICYYVLIFNLT